MREWTNFDRARLLELYLRKVGSIIQPKDNLQYKQMPLEEHKIHTLKKIFVKPLVHKANCFRTP